jgi:hypothetical protein
MEWKKYPQEKPEHDCMCYVTDSRSRCEAYLSIYRSHWDCFEWYNPEIHACPSLAVTHYFILPNLSDLTNDT